MSASGRALKQDPILFVLALAMAAEEAEARSVALAAISPAAQTTDADQAVWLITDHRLPREVVSTALLNEREVWETLLVDMSMTAMLLSLGKMSEVGLLVPGSAAEWNVVTWPSDVERLKRARVHPLQVLMAMAVYRTGHGLLGKLQWYPSPAAVDALNRAFYAAFANVEPSGKRLLIGLDVSASMGAGQCRGLAADAAPGGDGGR